MAIGDNQLSELLDRAAARRLTDRDYQRLDRAIEVRGDGNVVLSGKYNVRLDHGQDIQFGDRIYNGYSAENVREAIAQVMRHRSDDEIGPLYGVSGLVITLGVLVAFVGVALFGYGIYQMMSSPFDSLESGPPTVVFQGFGLAFVGIVIGNVGRLLRGWREGRR